MRRGGGTNGTVEVGEEGIYMMNRWRVEEEGQNQEKDGIITLSTTSITMDT